MAWRGRVFWLIALLQIAAVGGAPPSARGETDLAQTAPRLAVEIVSPQDQAVVSAPLVKLQVVVRSAPGTTVRLYPLVDGQRLATAGRGLTVGEAPSAAAPAPLGEVETVQILEVPIPRASCSLAVVAESALGTAQSAAMRLNWQAEGGFVLKPKLYLLAVGVSAYREAALALRYASKDAADFARAFAAQQGGLYEEVHVRTLLDGQASRDNILDGLQWLQRQTTANDVAILFLAGHGIADPSSGVYYFVPQDAESSAVLRSMIPQQIIQTTLRSIAGKALLFLDTCHAASVMNDAAGRAVSDVSRLLQELARADNGLLVYAAASGRQLSQESARWNNGVFTKAAIEGIRGGAAYHAGRPITSQMLNLYISERVKELTSGLQTPILVTTNKMADFPLAIGTEQPAVAPPRAVPVYKKWWFWTTLAAVVAGGVTAGVVVGTQASAGSPDVGGIDVRKLRF